MKIKKGDKVKIIAGKDKNKEGTVLAVLTLDNKVIVEGVNKAKKHVKPGKVSKDGGIISIERPLHVSNVMLVDTKTGNPIRVGYKVVDGKKYRFSRKTNEVLGLSAGSKKKGK